MNNEIQDKVIFSCLITRYDSYDQLFKILCNNHGVIHAGNSQFSVVFEDSNGKYETTKEKWQEFINNKNRMLCQIMLKRFNEGVFKEFKGD